MYPNLHFAFKEWFGVDWQWLKVFNTFGLMMAVSFIAAAVVLSSELRRRQKLGWLGYTEEKILVGQPATPGELLVHFILGFLLGFKILGGIISGGLMADPQAYIGSGQGSIPMGLLLGGLLVYLKWREKDKLKLAKPEQRVVRIWPHDRVGDMTIIAAIGGLAGAKLFHFFENWSEFVKDPWGNIASTEGLTFYGGLIVAAIAILLYARRKNINLWQLVDSAAPALMIAYAIGRIGCQLSGDGDWGIHNSAYITTPQGTVAPASDTANINTYMHKGGAYAQYFTGMQQEIGEVPARSFKAPSFLPRWTVAMNYAHNVNDAGVPIEGYAGKKYFHALPVPVFPTPFYETVICGIFFFALWRQRKRIKAPGMIFGIYLVMNGAERFLVEKIRVNTRYDIFGFKPTQAEIISTLLVLGGLWMIVSARKRNIPPAATEAAG